MNNALASGVLNKDLSDYVEVPVHGCLKDERKIKIKDIDATIKKIWSIGGDNGWYQSNWLWEIRGFMDKLVGGVGLQRGRTNPGKLNPGDPLDFWRVVIADKKKRKLLLFAEMRLPGEAWLEFSIDDHNILHQVATFRPKGLWGRIYWYSVLPFHSIVFKGMIRNISS